MKGQTIIEVLIALTTAVIIVSAITIAVITSLRNAEYSKTQNAGTRYAQEGLEFVRFMRDSNYPVFKQFLTATEADPTKVYCLGKDSTTLTENTVPNFPCTSSSVTIDNIFSRIISFEPASTDCAPLAPSPSEAIPTNTGAQVTVSVAWTDAKCPSSTRCHQAKVVSCLSDYTLVPTITNTLISASPNPCTLFGGICSATITLNAVEYSNLQIKIRESGTDFTAMGANPTGSYVASDITASGYTFDLYSGIGPGAVLIGSVFVKGI